MGSHITLSQIDTLQCQQNTLRRQQKLKEGERYACYVATVVGKRCVSGRSVIEQ